MDLSTMQQSLLVCFSRRRHIPEQIVLEILSRLPVQSLLRFRCVCKVWKSLISDPKFTLSTQKHHLAIKGRYLYSISLSWRRYPRFKPMLFYDDKSASERLKIIGSCNGLFLVTHYTDFYLWNPSIRQSAIVLSLRTDEWPKDFSLDACAYPSGLCYDSSTDDYKAVMANELGEVTVVSFKRKLWATTTLHFVDKGNGYISLPGPIVNEKLHWAIAKFGNNHVTSFNPRTDEFEELPMPLLPNNGEGEPVINGLGVLDGCLCMARCVTRGSGAEEVGPGFFELLVMKEYGVGGSWTRILNVSKDFTVLSRETLVPLCFTGDGEVVISVAHLDRLRAYNLEDMSQREINVPFEGSITYQTSYTESLVSPEAYGHEEVWIVEAPDFLKGDGPIDLLSGKEKEKEKTKSTAAENQSDKQTNTRKKFGGARFA